MTQSENGMSSSGADVALNQLGLSMSRPSHHSVKGKDVEFQHSVGDPLGLSAHLKEESEIKANISRRRQGTNRAADGLKKFYESQNEDIKGMLKSVDEHEQGEREAFEKHNLLYQICTKGSLIANVFLAALQLYGAISSGSLSLITTCADSVLDPMSGLMLYMSHRAVDKVDHHKFPSGRARISTAGNIVFSFIMFSISLVLIVLSARDLAAGSLDETNGFHLPSVIAVTGAFATKLGLFFLCWTVKDIYSQVDILWRDHRNDLFINGFGILTSVGGSKLRWWIDPLGAIVLSVLIASLWLHTAYEEFQLLIGVSADRETLQLITYICEPTPSLKPSVPCR